MPKKRRRSTKRRRAPKRNPSPRRRYTRRAVSRARSAFGGLNFKSALKNLPYFQAGMFGSKWMAKRFGAGASETDPESWGWREYLQGGLGAVATAFICNMIKSGSGQRVLEGGLNLMVYEMIQNELVAGSEWAVGQFGEEGDYYGDYGYLPGEVEEDETGQSYLLGQDYQWQALPEEGMEGVLEPVGPLGQLEPVGPLGTDPYRDAILES